MAFFVIFLAVVSAIILIAALVWRLPKAYEPNVVAEMSPYEADREKNLALKSEKLREDRRFAKRLTAAISGGFLAFFGIVLFFMIFTVVDAGEVGVEVRFGEVKSVRAEGWHFVNPFSDVVYYPIRLVESTYTDTVDEGEKAGADAIQAFSRENAAVFVDLTVLWSVDPAMADVVYRTVKDQYRETLVRPITRSATRDCVAKFDFDVARTTARGEVSQCIVDRMEEQLASKGIIVESIQLRNMTADATLQQSIEQKLQAANAVKEAEFRRDQAEVDKQRRIIEAEAEKEAAIIDAEGKAQSEIIAAEANAQKIEIESEAQAEANILIDASLNPPILSLLQVEALAEGGNLVLIEGSGVTPLLNVGG